MKLAIIGSRNLQMENIDEYIPNHVNEIVSGGARGIDSLAAEYARRNGIRLTEFYPNYARFGRGAPLKRNEQIAEYADMAIAFWDGRSRGTLHTIQLVQRKNKSVTVIQL